MPLPPALTPLNQDAVPAGYGNLLARLGCTSPFCLHVPAPLITHPPSTPHQDAVRAGYGNLLARLGRTFVDFLCCLNNLHLHLR